MRWVSKKLDERRTRIERRESEAIKAQFRKVAERRTQIDNLLALLRSGEAGCHLPVNFLMQPSEQLCWVEPGVLNELRVVSRHYEGGSSGLLFRVAKGVRFNVSGSRGHLVSETGFVAVSSGYLILTNKRLAFVGDEKSIAVKLDNLLEIQPAVDGLRFCDGKSSKPKLVMYSHRQNADVVCAVLNFMFEQ